MYVCMICACQHVCNVCMMCACLCVCLCVCCMCMSLCIMCVFVYVCVRCMCVCLCAHTGTYVLWLGCGGLRIAPGGSLYLLPCPRKGLLFASMA